MRRRVVAVRNETDLERLNSLLENFWEIESSVAEFVSTNCSGTTVRGAVYFVLFNVEDEP